MNTNNTLLLENIENLRVKRGIKIGELENALGVSVGFFSRIAKNPESFPSFEIIVKICNLFEIGIETLLTQNLDELGADERKIVTFIDLLLTKTQMGLLNWSANTQRVLFQLGVHIGSDGAFRHQNDAQYSGIPLEVQAESQTTIQLYPFVVSGNGNNINLYEVYAKNGEKKIPLFSTDSTHPIIQKKTNELFTLAQKTISDKILSAEAKEYMDNYIGNASH